MSINLKQIRFFRRFSQISVLLLFIIVPILNVYGYYQVEGTLFEFKILGFTLIDPFSALQIMLDIEWGAHRRALSLLDIQAIHIFVSMFFTLLLAFFFGPSFCSWFCPYGFMSELVWKYLGPRKNWQTRRGDDKPRRFYLIKFVIFFIACVLVVILDKGPIGNALSMPGWYSMVLQELILHSRILYIPIAFFFIMLLLELLVKKRFWCLYLCPQSVLLAIAARFSPFRMHIKFEDGNCTCPENNKSCLTMCSLGLNSRKLVGSEKMQCVNCFECARACARGCKSYHKGIQPIFTFKE